MVLTFVPKFLGPQRRDVGHAIVADEHQRVDVVGVVGTKVEVAAVVAQPETFACRDLIYVWVGFEPDREMRNACLRLDNHSTRRHIAVLHRRDTANDLDRLNIVGRNRTCVNP